MGDVMSEYFVLDHNRRPIPVDPFEWSDTFCKDPEGRQLDKTEVDGYVIITVFLGFGDPTIMFETVVYKNDIKQVELTSDYLTWDDAFLGHSLTVDRVTKVAP